jgi:aryl sulfotransferase
MSRFVWLASYPKSGNTWVRVFLANYQSTAPDPADINGLDNCLQAAARLPFDDLTGVEASMLTRDEIDRCRAAALRLRARQPRAPRFAKVHDCYRWASDDQPLFPADLTEAAIYIIRNPLDVVVSFAHHTGRTMQETIDDLCSQAFALASASDWLPEQLPQHVGSWSHHVRSWLDDSGLPVEVFRYEDLLSDPAASFARLVVASKLPLDAARLAAAIEHSRFDQLRAQEEQSGFRERPVRAQRFFRSGRTGAWRAVLSPSQIEQVIAAHGETMRRFGYLPLTTVTASASAAGGAGQP